MATVDCREGLLATANRIHYGLCLRMSAMRNIIAADMKAQVSLLTKQKEAANAKTFAEGGLKNEEAAVKKLESAKSTKAATKMSLESQVNALKVAV